MFLGVASKVGTSAAAPWKLGLLLVAGFNVLVFHTGVYRTVAQWDLQAPPPVRARAAALVSAVAWIGVIVAGRFIAY
jgi:hypothetical protein